MANLRNKILASLALVVISSVPAFAEDYNALSHADGISLSAGDSSRANIAIQTPTPWPAYLNNTTIYGSGKRGADLMEMYLSKFAAQQQANPSTVININQPAK